ncbi:hypothetical protein L1987_14862 [Smallanthus sonchifolius]|uniref:Uncharacterized protein n=1 Tax=Smallanthus sonchifolius TaxID=185202 RepID=A0ACB9J7G9_9ASTR|nr:hypothetical protein L1987_14862 [Smallanthus sonchifolius]
MRADGEDAVVSRSSARVSWARSLSVASSNVDTTHRSEFDPDYTDFRDSVGFSELLNHHRGNDLRVFNFAELKSATKWFNQTLMIGEGGFGWVYRGVVKVFADAHNGTGGGNDTDRYLDVATKQLDRNGYMHDLFPLLLHILNFVFFFLK